MPSILFKNARIIDPSQNIDDVRDLLVVDGKVSSLENSGKISDADQIVDISKKWLLPGLIDMHVHLREPGQEYKETIATGTRASVAGGFTSVACMANTNPVNDSPYITAFIREKAKAEGACRVFPIGAVTRGLKGEALAEIGGMVREGAVAISDDGMPVMNSYLMRKAMDYVKAFDIPVISHSEDANLVGRGVMNEGDMSTELGLRGNPSAAEEIMVSREISLCRLTGAKVHIAHVSTALAVEQIRRAKSEGLPLTAEVCPHHLSLTDERIATYDTHLKMAPPLRTQYDVDALIEGLADGTIDAIATDHAPHSEVDKKVEFDCSCNGIVGVETAIPVTLGLVHAGKISAQRWVESMTKCPAQILQIPHGTLKPGVEADITIVDPDLDWTLTKDDLHSKSLNSPYIGESFKGRVTQTWVGGEKRYELNT